MNVIIPIFVATKESLSSVDAYLTSSNIQEPDLNTIPAEQYWDATVSYALGEQVTRPNFHMIYENILAGINATPPEIDSRLAVPTRWVRKRANNKYAMFDTLRNNTSTSNFIDFTISPSQRVTSFYANRLQGSRFIITMTLNGQEIYRFEQNLEQRLVLSWFDYFFKPFEPPLRIVKFDMPPFFGTVVRVQIVSNNGIAALGSFVIGQHVYMGEVTYGAVISDLNFSRIDRNFDGSLELLQRRSVSKIRGQIYAEKSETNKLRELKQKINAIPAVFSGLDDKDADLYFDGLLMLGVYKVFDISLETPTHSVIDFEIEET